MGRAIATNRQDKPKPSSIKFNGKASWKEWRDERVWLDRLVWWSMAKIESEILSSHVENFEPAWDPRVVWFPIRNMNFLGSYDCPYNAALTWHPDGLEERAVDVAMIRPDQKPGGDSPEEMETRRTHRTAVRRSLGHQMWKGDQRAPSITNKWST